MNLRRIGLIARRDFIGYIKTVGFWITFMSPLIGIAFALLFSAISNQTEPTRYVTILDETGQYEQLITEEWDDRLDRGRQNFLANAARFYLSQAENEELVEILREDGTEAGLEYFKAQAPAASQGFKFPEQKTVLIDKPAESFDALIPYLNGEQTIAVDGGQAPLAGLLYIRAGPDGDVRSEFWSDNNSVRDLAYAANNVFQTQETRRMLEQAGLTESQLKEARESAISSDYYSPGRAGGDRGNAEVRSDFEQKAPYVIGGVFGLFLWFAIFSGSYMLLMSLVEEKVNKILEMVLATTRFSEVLFGKLLGVALLTFASMIPWGLMSLGGLWAIQQTLDPEIMQMVTGSITPKMIVFFFVFFVLGYIFYGALFLALGSLAESMQDTQTLVTPVMLLLTACIMVVPTAMKTPDSAMIDIALWIPFSAPFAAIVNMPSDPPWIEIIGPMVLLLVSAAFVVWMANRLFKMGALSGTGLSAIKSRLAKFVGR